MSMITLVSSPKQPLCTILQTTVMVDISWLIIEVESNLLKRQLTTGCYEKSTFC